MKTPSPKICLTASGWLFHDGKVLLIHHKKMGIWLTPGGHVEDGELPHQAAEREFWEETGIKVEAVPDTHFSRQPESEFLPNPFATNLHWVCKENFLVRTKGADPKSVPQGWRARGCEQHVVFSYFVRPLGSVHFAQNQEETLGIGWFGPDEVKQLDTVDDIIAEAEFVFEKNQR